jgi:DNA modification methylase
METESLIEFINFDTFENIETINKSDKYRGIFSKEDKISFDNNTNEMRKEWQNT